MANIYGVQFDEINDYFNFTDDSAWDIISANGSQGYIGWMEVDDNTGSAFQYFFSNNSFNAVSSINLFLVESGSSPANTIKATPNTGAQEVTTPPLSFPTGKFLFVMQYNATNSRLELVICDEAGTATRITSASNFTGDIASSNWNLGRRTDNSATRFYGGKIFNWGKFDTLLSNAQIENLASDFLNYDPNDEFTPEIYFPMNEGAGTTITDDVLGLTGTGIGFPGNDSQWILEGQSGGGISITEQTTNTNYSSLDPVISLTGTISITENLVNTNYTALNPTVTLSAAGVISVTEQLVNVNYTGLDPVITLTGVISITEQLTNTNYTSLNPTITLTSGAIEIVEQTVNTQYEAKNPSILLTPEPLGIVSTVCFDGVLVKVEFNGLQNNLEYSGKSINIEFNGNFNELEFNGTIQTTCNPGSIKTNC